MAVILPNISDLKVFMSQLKAQALNKRQKDLAKVVVGQFEELLSYSEECTKELNLVDPYDVQNACYGLYGDAG